MPSPSRLLRLKERKLVQWGLAYLAAVAGPVAGVVELAADPWGISPAAQWVIHVLLIAGFLLALILAWYHGEQGHQRIGRTETALLVLLLAATGGTISLLPSGERPPAAGDDNVGPLIGPRVVVLPVENRTDDPSLDPIGLQAADYIREGLARAERVQTAGPMAELTVSTLATGSGEGGPTDLSQSWTEETDADLAVLGAFYSNGDSIRFLLDVRARDGTILEPVDLTFSL